MATALAGGLVEGGICRVDDIVAEEHYGVVSVCADDALSPRSPSLEGIPLSAAEVDSIHVLKPVLLGDSSSRGRHQPQTMSGTSSRHCREGLQGLRIVHPDDQETGHLYLNSGISVQPN